MIGRFCSVMTLIAALASSNEPGTADDSQTSRKTPESVTAAEQIKGRWVRFRDTNDGRYKIMKEHTGDESTVTTFDPRGNVVYEHRSEYTIDDSGACNVFRYRNRVIAIGKNAGQVDPTERAYLFRVEGDQFIEVHGMLKSDSGLPSLTVWKRVEPKRNVDKALPDARPN